MATLLGTTLLTGCGGGGGITVVAGASGLRFVIQPSDVGPGEVFTVSIEVVDDGQGRVTSGTYQVTLTVNGGVALDGTTSKATSGGVATFDDLTISAVVSNLRLTASAEGLSSAQSTAFTITDPCTVFAGDLAPGQMVNGSLAQLDCHLRDILAFVDDQNFVDRWRMNLTATTSVRLDLTSSQVDAFLILTDGQGNLLAFDDDGGTGTDARIAQTLAPGLYVVLASSIFEGETGAYQLQATMVDPCDAVVGSLALDVVRNGTLAQGDCVDTPGRLVDFWRLLLLQPTTFESTVSTGAFAPFAGAFADGGIDQISGVFAAGPGDAAVEHLLPEGTYWIFASSADIVPEAPPSGNYTIEVATVTEPQDGCHAFGTAVTGGSVADGRITADDCTLGAPSPARSFDGYAVYLRAGETITATLTANFNYRFRALAGGADLDMHLNVPAGQTRELEITAVTEGFHEFYVLSEVVGGIGTYTMSFSAISGGSPPLAQMQLMPALPPRLSH